MLQNHTCTQCLLSPSLLMVYHHSYTHTHTPSLLLSPPPFPSLSLLPSLTHTHTHTHTLTHPIGKWLACQSMDNQILMYGVHTNFRLNRRKSFKGHMVAGYACSVDFSPEGRLAHMVRFVLDGWACFYDNIASLPKRSLNVSCFQSQLLSIVPPYPILLFSLYLVLWYLGMRMGKSQYGNGEILE